jgi:signal transduction histidine kinase
MKRFVFIILAFYIFQISAAEDAFLDSLKHQLESSSGADRVEFLNALSKACWQIDPAKALEYGEEAKALSEEIRYETGTAKALNNIGGAYFFLGDVETALDYMHQALTLRKKIGDQEEIITILNNIGIIYDAINDFNQSLEYYLESLKLEQQIGNEKGIAASMNNIGIVYENLSNYNKALEYFLMAMQKYENINDLNGMAATYGNIGLIYGGLTNYDKALEYDLKALAIYEELNDLTGIAGILSNIGIIYDDLGNNELALEYYLRALEIEERIGNEKGIAGTLNNIGVIYDNLKNYLQAIEYYKRSLQIYKDMGDLNGVSDASNNIGVAYQNLNDLKNALEYLFLSLDTYREIGRIKGEAAALNNIGTVYIKLRNYNKAEEYLLQGLQLATQIDVRDLLIEIYNRLSDVKVAQNDFKTALDYFRLYSNVKDSIFSKEKIEIIAGMQATYEVQMLLEDREREIEILQKNNEIYRLEAEKKNLMMWLLIFGLVVVLSLTFVIFYRYRLNKKNTLFLEKQVQDRTKDLRRANEQLTSEIKERKLLENQLIRSERLAAVGELSAGIAHEIRNPLGNISSSAQICLAKYEPSEKIKSFLEIIQEESEKANAIIKSLLDFANPREIKLKKASLDTIINEVLNSVNARALESNIRIKLSLKPDLPQIMLDEEWIKQAIQNLLLNAFQAMPQGGRLNIATGFGKNYLKLTIEDDGCGISSENLTKVFDPFFTTREDGVGLGLSLCHQIISDHKGKMHIESKENIGTKVILTFPLAL